MRSITADVAVVGSGICGVLVARELVRAGREVTVLERGGSKSHADQLAEGSHERAEASAAHNHEHHPDSEPYHWDYVYGVGGSSLHWAGVAPRLLPSDFELHSRYGLGRDWPIGYDDLVPFYEEAEGVLEVAGRAQPPHPYSAVDRLIAPLLEPYEPLPQARATLPVNGRPPCSGTGLCVLCPIDARYSVLHTLGDERLGDLHGFELRDRTVAARLRTAAGRVEGIECVSAAGDWTMLRPNVVVLAANGIENAAILLRSQFPDPDIGRHLFDHEHRLVHAELDGSAGHGPGNALATGVSYAYAEGDWRAERGSMLVLPVNPGLIVSSAVTSELVAGRRGGEVRRNVQERFDRTLVLDTVSEDLPRAEQRIELSPTKDSFGLPFNRISFRRDSDYMTAGRRFVDRDLQRRLAPLGARVMDTTLTAAGGHQLGTCYMGDRDGVVNADQRHHHFGNLYVAGGSAFPTYGAPHPTLTIAALALRLGRHIAAAHS